MYKINLRDNYMCKVTPNERHVPKISTPPPPLESLILGMPYFEDGTQCVKCCEIISFLFFSPFDTM
jgi:hypothetical protein